MTDTWRRERQRLIEGLQGFEVADDTAGLARAKLAAEAGAKVVAFMPSFGLTPAGGPGDSNLAIAQGYLRVCPWAVPGGQWEVFDALEALDPAPRPGATVLYGMDVQPGDLPDPSGLVAALRAAAGGPLEAVWQALQPAPPDLDQAGVLAAGLTRLLQTDLHAELAQRGVQLAGLDRGFLGAEQRTLQLQPGERVGFGQRQRLCRLALDVALAGWLKPLTYLGTAAVVRGCLPALRDAQWVIIIAQRVHAWRVREVVLDVLREEQLEIPPEQVIYGPLSDTFDSASAQTWCRDADAFIAYDLRVRCIYVLGMRGVTF